MAGHRPSVYKAHFTQPLDLSYDYSPPAPRRHPPRAPPANPWPSTQPPAMFPSPSSTSSPATRHPMTPAMQPLLPHRAPHRSNSMQRRRSITLSRTPSGTYRCYEQPSIANTQDHQQRQAGLLQQPYYSQVVEPSSPMTLTPTHKGFQKWSTYTKKKKPSLVPRPPLLLALTVNIGSTLERIDPSFSYDPDSNPKRILTRPSKPAKNDGYDNEHSDYILFVNDILGEGETRYRVIDLLGQGTYGQVVKCEHLATKELYSVKVVKNRANFRSESYMEANILKRLNEHPGSKEHILTLVTTFIHKNHFCLVFELLSFNLLELIRQTGFRGLPIALVRTISHQLLQALDFLLQSSVIHCDLKPENILLESVDSPKIKVIDFGSACYRTTPKYTYIQSRYYRSPEVILKVPYSHGIDMWSLGCIVAELFLGSPLFPGHTEFHQLNLIMDLLGEPMSEVLERGKDTFYYFDLESQHGRTIFKRKPVDKYNKDHNKAEKAHAPAHKYTTLKDIIMNHGQHHINKERLHPLDEQMREQLTDFLQQCLNLRPLQRWKPAAALTHPFITGVFELPAHPQPGLRHQRSRSLHAPNASVHRDQASLEPRRRATFTSHTDAERRTKKIHPGAASASAGPN